jgi:phage shock protein C
MTGRKACLVQIRKEMTMDKKLRRSKNDAMIAGVAGGIAEYFNVDPVLIRLAFVLTAVLGGPGLLIYIIMWIIMPESDKF